MQNAERPVGGINTTTAIAPARAAVRAAVLGPVLVAGKSGALESPSGALGKALIAALALGAMRPIGGAVGVDTLVDTLWPDEPPRQAKAALQTLVSRTRGITADGLLRSGDGGYGLHIAHSELDLGCAAQLGAEAAALAQAGDPAAAMGRLDAALVLWRGEPGADLPDGPIRDELVETAARLRSQLLELRARCLLDAGHAADAARGLRALLDAEPLNEALALLHMRALAEAGRGTEAIAAFAAFRTRLREDLGASPGAEITAANAELLQADTAVLEQRTAAIGLRAAPNELIGRERDLLALERLLTQSRLVTILGAGGLGKTRLAQAVAHRSVAPAVVVVELASVRSDDDILLAFTTTLGIRELAAGQRLADAVALPDLRGRVLAELSSRPTLLVVDNCEHVIEGAAGWIAQLLAAAPRLHVLATSRSPLELTAERIYALQPLASTLAIGAEADGPAVRLFVERAHAARPSATLPLDLVSRLCTRLDGLPLAIELAAARVRSLSVEQIESRLQDRFALLTGGDRSAPERHQTLLAVIEWSWNLLRPREQSALARLSVFADGFSTDAAASVIDADAQGGQASAAAGDSAIDIIDALVAQSLVTVSEHPLTGDVRYRMLETVREFGQARLRTAGEVATAHRALRRWASSFSRAALEDAQGPRQIAMFRSVTMEQDNLVTILRSSIDAGDAESVVDIFALLSYYWTVRSAHSEVAAFGPAVIEATRGYAPDSEHMDAAVSSFAIIAATSLFIGEAVGTRALVRVRALLARPEPLTPRLRALGTFLIAAPDLDVARGVLDDMCGSTDRATALLGNLFTAQAAENDGEPIAAARAASRAWELAAQVEDTWAEAMSAMMMAQLSSQSAHSEDALRWSALARTGLEALDVPDDLRQLEWIHGASLLGAGRVAEARAVFDRFSTSDLNSEHALELRSIGQIGFAEAERIDGDPAVAQRLFAQGIAGFRTGSQRSSPWFQMALSGFIAAQLLDGTGTAEEIARNAATLRSRVLGYRRARPGFTDKPVLGTSATGLALWALTQEPMQAIGFELFALAEGLHGRQDLPSLNAARHRARIDRLYGSAALTEASDGVARLSLNERAERAYVLLDDAVWR